MSPGRFSRAMATAVITVFGVFVPSVTVANTPVTGAGFTTVNETVDGSGHCKNGNPAVNCNIYDGKDFVWLNGGPSVAYVGDGSYFFAVLDPGGQANPNDGAPKNLSDVSPTSGTGAGDAYTNRVFTVTGGTVSYAGTHTFANNKIRLMPYDDTTNPGGVYIMAICSLADGYPVNASDCKYDAFKVQQGEVVHGLPLTISKDANGANDKTYAWQISKNVDKTKVTQASGNVTFNYTVGVTHNAGTVSNVGVTGTISVFNPNVDGSNATVPVSGVTVTDKLSDNTVCAVTGGSNVTLTQFQTDFAYSCTLSGLPGQLNNTATVTWGTQFLDNGAILDAGTANFTFSNISFTENAIDECVNVTDTYAGALGTVCVGDANPTLFHYSRVIPVLPGCVSYDNTATFTTNDTATTGSASKTVTVCGPINLGAHTMGFWQNKNGQGIITSGASVAGVCKSGTWLRTFAPFQDLSPTATCAQVASYVYNVIKAASSAGSSLNPMLKAQDLATSLSVYFSDPALGGNKIGAPVPIGGVHIDLTKICKDAGSCSSFENASSAFGGATDLTVLQIITYEASQSNAGGSVWYGQVKATQELAKDVNDAINNNVVFAP
jgi:hypothetical protein